MAEWQVHSHHINVKEGDCAVHLLVQPHQNNNETTYNIEAAVLIDGGRGEGADHIKSFVWFAKMASPRYNHSFTIFHSVVITHWDADHKDGIAKYFLDDIKGQIDAAIRDHLINDEDKLQQMIHNGEITPTTVKADTTFWFAPYWWVGFRDVSYSCKPPENWSCVTADGKKLFFIRVNTYLANGTPVLVQMPMGYFIIGGDTGGVLGCDIFTRKRIFDDPTIATSPSVVCKALHARTDGNASKPAMLCIAVDQHYCGGSTVANRQAQYIWDFDDLSAMKLVKRAKSNDDNNTPEGHDNSAGPGIRSIDGHTTGNNQASIVSMICWPDPAEARVTHYLGGDAGDTVEEGVLHWAVEEDPHNPGAVFLPVKIPAIKLSHHGAKFSTPIAMLPAWQPKWVVCPNGLNGHHNHISWPTSFLIRAWSSWSAWKYNEHAARLYCLNYPIYLVDRWKEGPDGVKRPIMKPGSLDPLLSGNAAAQAWKDLIVRFTADSRNSTANEVEEELKGMFDRGGDDLVLVLAEQWNEYSAILDGEYFWGSMTSDDQRDMVIRDIEVIQAANQVSDIRWYSGLIVQKTMRHTEGAWNFASGGPSAFYSSPDEEIGHEWSTIGSGDVKSFEEWEDDLVVVDWQSAPRQQKPMNKRTTAPWLRSREHRRSLGASLISQTVGDGLRRAVWGDAASSQAASEDTTLVSSVGVARKEVDVSPTLQYVSRNSVESQFYLVSTTTKVKGSDPLNSTPAKRDSPLDLVLERLSTGALVLNAQPTAQRTTISLDDSDELVHFFRDLFSPVTDDSCRMSVDVDVAGVYGFETTLDLTDLLAPKPKTLARQQAGNVLTFKTANNGTSFKALPGNAHPPWVTGGAAGNPDCFGPAQMIVMSLAPDTPTPEYRLDQILRLVNIEDNGMSKYFSLLTSFQLANDAGSRNALWFIPKARHTATLRLVFKPFGDNLTKFCNNMLDTVHTYLGLEKLEVTEPRIVAKRTWTQEVGGPPTSEAELDFLATITFKSEKTTLKLNSVLAIKQYAVNVVVSFEDNGGLKPTELLDFIADMFTGKNSVPLNDFFPHVALDNVRLLRVMYQMNEGSKMVGFDFQINWANLVLKVIITYNMTAKKFGLYGRLFPENRPQILPDAFNFIPYMPEYEPWTVLPRASVGNAQCQVVEGVANLADIYRQLTKTAASADGDTLTPGPFEMDLLQLNWSLEDSVITFDAVVVCPERDPKKTYRLPPIQFTAGALDLKFDFKDPKNKIKRVAVIATFIFRALPQDQKPKLVGNGAEAGFFLDCPSIQTAEEDDLDKEEYTCSCTVGLEYADSLWSLYAGVEMLSGAMLHSIFDDDCNYEVVQLLKNVYLDLDIKYQYDSKGEGSSFDISGALYINSLQLRCEYHHQGNGSWEFTADLKAGNQNASLLSLAEALFDINHEALPAWVGDIEATSSAVHAADAASLASLEIVSLEDRLVVIFRFKLSDGATVVFYQSQEKKKKDETARKKPKRALMLSVAGLPGIPAVPLIGSIKQPIEELDFIWVLDGNNNPTGFTRGDLTALGNAINKARNKELFPALRYRDTIPKGKDGEKGNQKDSDVLLAPGFHFLVSNTEKVLLDYAFGGPKKDKNQDVKSLALSGDFHTEDTATTPINKKFGPVTLLGLGIGFDLGTNTLSLALDGSLELGPLAFTLIGFEVSFGFEKGATLRNVGKVKRSISLSGMGASFERKPILLAGLFERGKMPNGDIYYQGAASVGFAPYEFRAAGFYGESTSEAGSKEERIIQRPLSLDDFDFVLLEEKKKFTAFLVYCSLEGTLMTIGYAEVRGLTGGFGYNTSITMPTVDSVVNFPFLSTPKTGDTQGKQGQLVGTGWFGVREGSYWVAAGLTLLAFQMLAVSAVVVVEWNPGIKLGLFGVATAEMPRKAEFIFARVQLALAATIDFDAGILRVDGQLTPASFVLDPHCHLTGGFALYAWFGKGDPAMQGSWVFTIGGYHPRFVAPAQFPMPPRLGISWSYDDHISITGEAYFAITPKVCMGGGRLHVTLSLGPLSAYFDAYADFLIQYRPFFFETDGGLSVGVHYTLDLWLVSISISVDIAARLHLEGPPIRGTVHVDFWVFGFDVSFGTAKISSKALLPIDDFFNLVLQSDAKPPSTLALEAGSSEQADAPPPAAHVLSCTSGIVADSAKTAPAAGDMWRVRGAVFVFTISCKFVFDGAEVVSVFPHQDMHTHAHTPKPKGKDKYEIFARPMGLRNAINSSMVTVTITRHESEVAVEEDQLKNSDPPWINVAHSVASLPTALWGQADSSDLLDGTKDTVIELPNMLSLHAPGAKMSHDKIVEFDVAKSMGQVACEEDFPTTVPMGPEWDPAPPLTPPKQQYDHVKNVWQAPNLGKTAGAEFADFWCRLPVFGWLDDHQQPLVRSAFPEKLATGLEGEYTEAPRVNGIVISCF